MGAEVAAVRKAMWTAAAALMLTLVFARCQRPFRLVFKTTSRCLWRGLIAQATSLVPWSVGEALIIVGAPVLLLLLIWAAVRRKAPRGGRLGAGGGVPALRGFVGAAVPRSGQGRRALRNLAADEAGRDPGRTGGRAARQS